MTDRMHQQLLGHLLGALDDAEEEQVDARLEHDERWRQELVRWRRRLGPLEVLRPDFEPPPGLAARTCRLVAACLPTPRDILAPRRRMSPDLTPPSRIARVGWHDLAIVALLLVTTGAVLLPAIHGSRFHARVATCQDGLRQFGTALSQYSHQHGNTVSQFARNGRLTPAGTYVAGLFDEGLLTEQMQGGWPNAWLAAQGVERATRPVGQQIHSFPSPRAAVARSSGHASPGPKFLGPPPWVVANTSGTRSPLLADDPGDDPSRRPLESHGGRGRNVLFEDGHIDFLPGAVRELADVPLPVDGIPAGNGISAPIVFVSGH